MPSKLSHIRLLQNSHVNPCTSTFIAHRAFFYLAAPNSGDVNCKQYCDVGRKTKGSARAGRGVRKEHTLLSQSGLCGFQFRPESRNSNEN